MMFKGHVYRAEAVEGEDGGGAEVVGDKTPKVEAVESVAAEVSPDIIAKAEKMGWTPKGQFKGDPDKWRPADEFVERGENMLPLVRAQVKRQEREISELKTSIKQFAEYHDKAVEGAYKQAMADLKAQRAAAIKAGDGETFDRVDEEIDNLKDKIKETEAKGPQSRQQADADFAEWLDRNKWANDPKMQQIGVAIREDLFEANPTLGHIELLDLTAKEVKKRFPEKFENPRRNAAAAVEGSAPPRKSGGKTYADLPADARAACERMARNGYADKPKEMADFKAAYVKNYFSEEA